MFSNDQIPPVKGGPLVKGISSTKETPRTERAPLNILKIESPHKGKRADDEGPAKKSLTLLGVPPGVEAEDPINSNYALLFEEESGEGAT